MQVLTPTGYKNVEDLSVGDEVSAFDMSTGDPIVNTVQGIDFITREQWIEWYGHVDPMPAFSFVKINGDKTFFAEQSVWANDNVKHMRDVVVGDIIYDDADADVIVTSVETVDLESWYRFHISGDHSFIADGFSLHNANRFWVSGTGTWDSSTTTQWSTTTGGGGGASVPGSADTAIFDASSGGGTVTVAATLASSNTLTGLTAGLFTGTLAFNTNNPSITFSGSCAPGQSGGTGVRSINTGSGTFTFTGSNLNNWDCTTTTNLTPTFTATNFVMTVPTSSGQTFAGNGLSYGPLTVNGRVAASSATFNITGSNTFSSYTATGNATINSAFGTTQAITNGSTWGSTGNTSTWVNASGSGTFQNLSASSIQWVIMRSTTMTGTSANYSNSIDLGGNSGAALGTFTPPTSGTSGGRVVLG